MNTAPGGGTGGRTYTAQADAPSMPAAVQAELISKAKLHEEEEEG